MDAEICPANIGPKERRKRLVFGIVCLAVGAGSTTLLVSLDVARGWRLLLFLPFAMGAVGVLQARAKT